MQNSAQAQSSPGFARKPDYRMIMEPAEGTCQAVLQGCTLASSDKALRVSEGSYDDVIYFPKEDLDMTLFTGSDHQTHCPFKGDASYLSSSINGVVVENIAWTYEVPFIEALALEGFVAFYTDKLDGPVQQ